ncbi:hypothetical protein D3C86_1802540 [compost metagenome]
MNEVQDVVNKINNAIFYSKYSEHEYISYLECVETPVETFIKFMNQCIWSSDNDAREYSEISEDYEPLENYLVSEISKMLEVNKHVLKAIKGEV